MPNQNFKPRFFASVHQLQSIFFLVIVSHSPFMTVPVNCEVLFGASRSFKVVISYFSQPDFLFFWFL